MYVCVQESSGQKGRILILQQLQELSIIIRIKIDIMQTVLKHISANDNILIKLLNRKSVGKRNMLSAQDLNEYYLWLQLNG